MDCNSYSEVRAKMQSFVYEEFPTKHKNPIAYTLKHGKGFDSGSLKIFLPPENKGIDLNHYLFVHEAGHIIFNHSLGSEIKEDILKDRLEQVYNENIDLFKNKKDFFNTFFTYVFNVAQDFEVNSKFFTKDEFDYLNKIISDYIGLESKGMWPEDYGFPVGENWRLYLNMIIEHLRDFIKNYKKNNSSESNKTAEGDAKGDQNSNSTPEEKSNEHVNDNSDDEDEENGEEDEENKTDTNEDNESLTDEDIEEISKEVEETSEENLSEREETKDAEKTIQSRGDSTGDKAERYKINEKRENDITEVVKIIEKELFKESSFERRDLLYKSNRFCESVIRPKYYDVDVLEKKTFFLVLDVSGSMSEKFITDVILSFRKLAKKFKKDSRVIFWNDELVLDKEIRDSIDFLHGGNTDIGAAFEYINLYYKSLVKDSVLFVISDFCDDLSRWHRNLSKLNTSKNIAISLSEERSNEYEGCWPGDFNNIYLTKQ